MDASQLVRKLWLSQEHLPASALDGLHLSGDDNDDPLPSSFRVGAFAQASIGATALVTSVLEQHRKSSSHPRRADVSIGAAAAEFVSERHFEIDGIVVFAGFDPLAASYLSPDGGYVRLHTNWAHHKRAALMQLGLPMTASKDEVAAAIRQVDGEECVTSIVDAGGVATSLRSFSEWDEHPQGRVARAHFERHGPIESTCDTMSPTMQKAPLPPIDVRDRPLKGIRVLDLTRVIAGPVAGRTLALYGADVLWVTAPHLPSLPNLDCSTSLGKRTVQLDLNHDHDRRTFEGLVRDADVLLQAYRPGALESRGFSFEQVKALNPHIIYASLSAWNNAAGGPWASRRGFDSLVQHATGIGVAEAAASNPSLAGERRNGRHPGRPLPAQALDHASGFLLTFGIIAALLKRLKNPPVDAQEVKVSLIGTALWLRELGQREHFHYVSECKVLTTAKLKAQASVDAGRATDGSSREWVAHAAMFDEERINHQRVPSGLDCNKPEWLPR